MAVNTNKAISLLSDVDKNEYNEKSYYQISPLMFRKINEKIPGKNGNQRTLLLYLIFQLQNGDFHPAEQVILNACGMVHSRYCEARKALHEQGFITYIKGQSITINYKNIMK